MEDFNKAIFGEQQKTLEQPNQLKDFNSAIFGNTNIPQTIPQQKPQSPISRALKATTQLPKSLYNKVIDVLSLGQYGSAIVASKALGLSKTYKDYNDIVNELVDTNRFGLGVLKENPEKADEVLKIPLLGNIATETFKKGVAKSTLGTVGNIFLDPVTYVTLGGAKGAQIFGKEIPVMGKGVRAITKAISPVVEGATQLPIVNTILRNFSENIKPIGMNKSEWEILSKTKQKALGKEKEIVNITTDRAIQIKKLIDSKIKQGVNVQQGLIAAAEEKPDLFKNLLPKEVDDISMHLKDFQNNLAVGRSEIGKKLLDSDEINYFMHLKKGETTGIKDYTRKLLTFTGIDNNAKVVGKAPELGLTPLNMRGMSPEHFGNMLSTTVKDLQQAENLAKEFGITVKYSPKPILRGGKAVGSFDPNGNIIRIATGGKTQQQILDTFSHELGHKLHGEMGSRANLYLTKTGKGQWFKVNNDLNNIAKSESKNLLDAFGISIADRPNYFQKPTELLSRFEEIYKVNPGLAQKISPKLYYKFEEALDLFKKYGKPEAESYFKNNHLFGELTEGEIPSKSFWQDKSGKLYYSNQPTVMDVYKPKKGEVFEGKKYFTPEEVKQYGADNFETLFETSIPHVMYYEGRKLARQTARKEFVDGVLGLSKGEGVSTTIPELKGKLFDPKTAEEIEKGYRFWQRQPQEMQKFLSYFDSGLNVWKAGATYLRPFFHLRNNLTNMFQNWLADVNPKNYKTAIDFMLKKGAYEIGGQKYTYQQLKDLLLKNDVIGHGFIGGDVEQNIAKILREKPSGFSWLNYPKTMRQVGVAVEDFARTAHFFDRLNKGYIPFDAAMSVKKYLFDYSALTPFEKQAMKRIFPFYSWIRKNVPLQIENIIKQPGKYLTAEKIQRGISNISPETEQEKRLKPDYFNEYGYFKTPITNKNKPIYATLGLPSQDINTSVADIVGMANPAAFKPFIELVANIDARMSLATGTAQPIAKKVLPGESWIKAGQKVSAPSVVQYLPLQARNILGVQYSPQTKQWVMPPRMKYILSQFIIAQNLSKTFEAKGESVDPLAIFSQLTGISVRGVDPQAQQRNLMYKRQQILRDYMSRQKKGL